MDLQPPAQSSHSTRYLIEGLILGIVIFVIVLLTLQYFGIANIPFFPKGDVTKKTSQSVFLTVGEESIYQQDFDREFSVIPPTDDNKNLIIKKLIRDSIILQEGAKKNITSLDTSTYNSLAKDYQKRLRLVQETQQLFQKKATHVTGTWVMVWFHNTRPAPIGYTRGKELAHSTISKLYDQVKNKEITIQQAGEAIQNNSELAKVDPIYKTNAMGTFNATLENPRITFMKEFDDMVWKLKSGEISPLYLGKDKDEKGNLIDAVYAFAQVASREDSTDMPEFEKMAS